MWKRDAFRVQVGRHRIIYRVEEGTLVVLVVAPGRRQAPGERVRLKSETRTRPKHTGRRFDASSATRDRGSTVRARIERGLASASEVDEVTADRSEEQVSADGQVAKMSRPEVLELVRMQLADILEMSPDKINESSSFTEDLNADSLALIELVESLEEELRRQVPGFRIDDEDLEDLRTVRDAVDYVTAKLEAA